MRRYSRLPEGEVNLFQRIKATCDEVDPTGKNLIKLSIGQPSGPALLSARAAAAAAILSEDERWHEYQDNGCIPLPDFAKQFAQFHVSEDLDRDEVAFLPVPGIKPMLPYIIQACGGVGGVSKKVMTMTDPGYPTPEDACIDLNQMCEPLFLGNENKFRVSLDNIATDANLLMLNYPHNPSGQIATSEFWEMICDICQEYSIRVFNDAAYIALSHLPQSSPLTDIAVNFPNLSWAEGFSASKVINNGTGWRVGAIIGSPDFVGDIAKIKGKYDSGFFAPAAAGVLSSIENDQERIIEIKEMYLARIGVLTDILGDAGKMRLAVKPGAGFFTLWDAPKIAFGEEMADAEVFNKKMIKEKGIVGVPFGKYIRYAVVMPVGETSISQRIKEGFIDAKVEY